MFNSPRIFNLICACFFLSASVSHADTLTTPFNIELSAPSAVALLGGVSGFKSPSGSLKTDLPDQNLTTPNAVSVTGIHLNLNYSFNTPASNSVLNEWTIQSKSIAAEIIVDAINTSQTVVVQSGGTTITLQVTASCNDVHLELAPGSTQMNATIDLSLNGNQAGYVLKDFAASWAPSAWQITSMNCQGPNGFPDAVKQSIAAELQSINPFLPAIQTQIQAQLNSSSGPVSWTLPANDQSETAIKLTPTTLQILPAGGAMISGTAAFSFSKLQNTACQTDISAMPANPTRTDSLVIPIGAVESLVQCAYLNGSVNASFTSKTFTAFQSLLGSWFQKIFVWPNLTKFNSNSLFNFNLAPTGTPIFGAMSSNKSGAFLFNLNAPMILELYAPESSGPMHYVDFKTSLSGPATLTVQNGLMTLKQSTSNLGVSYQWDQTYVQTYHPDQRIWTSVIAGNLKSFLAKTGVTYTLPTFEAPGAFSLSINSAVVNGTSANIGLGIKTLSSQTQ